MKRKLSKVTLCAGLCRKIIKINGEIREREPRSKYMDSGKKTLHTELCHVKDPIARVLLFRTIFRQIGHAYARTGISKWKSVQFSVRLLSQSREIELSYHSLAFYCLFDCNVLVCTLTRAQLRVALDRSIGSSEVIKNKKKIKKTI